MSLSIGPVIIDCDVGVDDAVAVALCLAHAVDIAAITCVHGNTSLDNVANNTGWLLRKCQRSEIPIYKGSDRNLVGKTCFAHEVHGEGGLGGISVPVHEGDNYQSEHAVTALLRMTNERPGEITLLAIGPLTNVALATRMDPGFTKRLKKLIIMGGNITGSLKGVFTHPGAEFNFYCDPEAAHVVLQEAECPVTVVPYETCYNTTVPWELYGSLRSTETSICRFLCDITENSISRQKERNLPGFFLCDALAAAITIDGTIIEESRVGPVDVERGGHYTRGQMLQLTMAFYGDKVYHGPKVTVVTKVHCERFWSLMSALKRM